MLTLPSDSAGVPDITSIALCLYWLSWWSTQASHVNTHPLTKAAKATPHQANEMAVQHTLMWVCWQRLCSFPLASYRCHTFAHSCFLYTPACVLEIYRNVIMTKVSFLPRVHENCAFDLVRLQDREKIHLLGEQYVQHRKCTIDYLKW